MGAEDRSVHPGVLEVHLTPEGGSRASEGCSAPAQVSQLGRLPAYRATAKTTRRGLKDGDNRAEGCQPSERCS